MGAFSIAPGGLKFCTVVVNYMTKWIEAKPLQRTVEKDCIKFFNDLVVIRFRIPRTLISDNGLQFVGTQFESYLTDLNIIHEKAFINHPQANDQV